MKLLIKKTLALALLIMMPLMSCSSDDSSSSNSQLVSQVQSQAVNGNWRVTLFNEDGVNKTYLFEGFNFVFTADGNVNATNSTDLVMGTWGAGVDDSSPKFILLFAVSSGPFEEISEDWRILSVSSTKMEFRHVSGGDGSIDLLTFTKN